MQQRRVLFGEDSILKLKEEVEFLGCSHPLLISTPANRIDEKIKTVLKPMEFEIFNRAMMHVPEENISDALSILQKTPVDSFLAIGGGSAIGMAKALALQTGFPIIVVPTTFSGSEMTPIWGITTDGIKKTGQDERVLPKTVIYEPDFFKSLPPSIAGVSALNAMAHCVEALYAENSDPVTDLMAEEGIRLIASNLSFIQLQKENLEFLEKIICGAWMAGMVLAMTTMGLHHKLCHVLGGTLNLPHAQTHAIVLPHVIAFNKDSAPEAMKKLSRGCAVDNASEAVELIYGLLTKTGAQTGLKDIGMKYGDIDRIAELATQNKYSNPRLFVKQDLISLLENAFWGISPV